MQPFRMMLFAADFSENSKEAFRVACSLAVENKTLLTVLHVVERDRVANTTGYSGLGSIPTSKTEGVHEVLKRRLSEVYIPNHPIDVDYHTNEGDAAEEILCTADEIGADLIVMGTHGRTGLRRLLAGSVADAVLRGAHCAVLALQAHAPERHAQEIRVVLYPMDSPDGSEAVCRVARSLARDLGAKLVLLHAVPFAGLPSEWTVPVDLQAYRDAIEAVRANLDGPDLKYPVEAQLREGNAADEILRVSREVGCDLIVMGTQGRTGLNRLVLGSVAESVLAKADCPVMVVRLPKQILAPVSNRPAEMKMFTIF